MDLILQAIVESSDECGWVNLGSVGSYVQKIRPDFDSRLYGSRKLSDLLRKHPTVLDVGERPTPGSATKAIVVRAMLST